MLAMLRDEKRVAKHRKHGDLPPHPSPSRIRCAVPKAFGILSGLPQERELLYADAEKGVPKHSKHSSVSARAGIRKSRFGLGVAIQKSPPSSDCIDNGILGVTVDRESGWIGQIVDLRDGREVLSGPGGNVLTLWKEDSFDNPSKEEWNAWDIGISEKSETAQLVSPPRRVESELGLPAIECIHRWGKSEFRSVIALPPDEDFVDVRLECDWQETLVLLRTEFCVNLPPEAEAWHEIAYGAVRRDKDGQEAPSHRWVDLSDADYGAALINDSRCAHSVKDNTIRMTLLRCATNPDPVSDRGTFTFHYRFRPHEGTWREADIVRSAYELNVPVAVFPGRVTRQPQLPSVEGEGVHVGACKVSEDGEGIVLRLYESRGGKSRAVVRVNERLGPAFETNLLEDVQREIEIEDGVIDLAFSPFEIKTLLLTVRSAG